MIILNSRTVRFEMCILRKYLWLVLPIVFFANYAKEATSFETVSGEILMKEATSEWWSNPERSMTFLDSGDVNNDGYFIAIAVGPSH